MRSIIVLAEKEGLKFTVFILFPVYLHHSIIRITMRNICFPVVGLSTSDLSNSPKTCIYRV